MFARIRKAGKYQYLQIVKNYRENKKSRQRVIYRLGRLEKLQQKGEIENLVSSLSRFSENVLMVLTNKSKINSKTKIIGPNLVFGRLWKELKIDSIIKQLLHDRKYEFDVERAIYLTVIHRLFSSGSDRSCDRWRRKYVIEGTEDLSLHHLYRSMVFLGEELSDKKRSFTIKG